MVYIIPIYATLAPRKNKENIELVSNITLTHALKHKRDLKTLSHFSTMLKLLNNNLRRLSSHLRWSSRRRFKPKLRFTKPTLEPHTEPSPPPTKPIRIATFNAAFFSMAPVLPEADDKTTTSSDDNIGRAKSPYDRPRSILKQSQPPLLGKSKLRVSINLPDNEISLRQTSFSEHERSKLGSLSWSWSFAEGGPHHKSYSLELESSGPYIISTLESHTSNVGFYTLKWDPNIPPHIAALEPMQASCALSLLLVLG